MTIFDDRLDALRRAQSLFWWILGVTLCARLALAALVPLSGDEAYFVSWGRHPDFGYYDHPPMVGWLLALLLLAGDHPVWLRLPAILLPAGVGLALVRMLRDDDPARAFRIASLYLVAPVTALNVLVTTDTPLILFASLSMLALIRALREDRIAWYALAGGFLGAAFLSKYFAVLLAGAYAVYFALYARARWRGFAALVLAALPFGLVNLGWNATHCWDNILFNMYNRHESGGYTVANVALNAGLFVYLITPPLLYFIWRRRAELGLRRGSEPFRLFAFAVLVPCMVFAALAARKIIGLHWPLAFYPFLLAFAGLILSARELAVSLRFMAWFTGLHVAALAVAAAWPLETWRENPRYTGMVLMFETDAVLRAAAPLRRGAVLASEGYTPASLLAYRAREDVAVFGEGSSYARQDDLITDFRAFDGRDILVVRQSAPDLGDYVPYFERIETSQVEVRGATFHFVRGAGFRYAAYRDGVLRAVRAKYYRIPSWLPVASCVLCERYFPAEPCTAAAPDRRP